MEYMEVPRPAGDGICSDDSCPCGFPGADIRRGEGYVYVSPEVVEFRRDCPTVAEAEAKVDRMRAGTGGVVMFASGAIAPILMCEQGARRRGLDMEIAAADAKYWWQTGLVPLRPTPVAAIH